MRAALLAAAALVLLALSVPAGAGAHAERATFFPDPAKGQRPGHRSHGPSRVVCKPDSKQRLKRSWKGRAEQTARRRRYLLPVLKRCRYRHIQQAVNAARTGDRLRIMPGGY